MPISVRIEPVEMAHAEEVQVLASHPAVIATTNLPSPYPEGGAVEWIQNLLATREAREEYAFAMVSETDGLVGITALVLEVGATGLAELGYWVGYPFWGRGYATAANRLVLDFGFSTLALKRVLARPLVRNRASRRVLEKLGFRHVATQNNPFPRFDPEDRIAVYEIKRWQWRV